MLTITKIFIFAFSFIAAPLSASGNTNAPDGKSSDCHAHFLDSSKPEVPPHKRISLRRLKKLFTPVVPKIAGAEDILMLQGEDREYYNSLIENNPTLSRIADESREIYKEYYDYLQKVHPSTAAIVRHPYRYIYDTIVEERRDQVITEKKFDPEKARREALKDVILGDTLPTKWDASDLKNYTPSSYDKYRKKHYQYQDRTEPGSSKGFDKHVWKTEVDAKLNAARENNFYDLIRSIDGAEKTRITFILKDGKKIVLKKDDLLNMKILRQSAVDPLDKKKQGFDESTDVKRLKFKYKTLGKFTIEKLKFASRLLYFPYWAMHMDPSNVKTNPDSSLSKQTMTLAIKDQKITLSNGQWLSLLRDISLAGVTLNNGKLVNPSVEKLHQYQGFYRDGVIAESQIWFRQNMELPKKELELKLRNKLKKESSSFSVQKSISGVTDLSPEKIDNLDAIKLRGMFKVDNYWGKRESDGRLMSKRRILTTLIRIIAFPSSLSVVGDWHQLQNTRLSKIRKSLHVMHAFVVVQLGLYLLTSSVDYVLEEELSEKNYQNYRPAYAWYMDPASKIFDPFLDEAKDWAETVGDSMRSKVQDLKRDWLSEDVTDVLDKALGRFKPNSDQKANDNEEERDSGELPLDDDGEFSNFVDLGTEKDKNDSNSKGGIPSQNEKSSSSKDDLSGKDKESSKSKDGTSNGDTKRSKSKDMTAGGDKNSSEQANGNLNGGSKKQGSNVDEQNKNIDKAKNKNAPDSGSESNKKKEETADPVAVQPKNNDDLFDNILKKEQVDSENTELFEVEVFGDSVPPKLFNQVADTQVDFEQDDVLDQNAMTSNITVRIKGKIKTNENGILAIPVPEGLCFNKLTLRDSYGEILSDSDYRIKMSISTGIYYLEIENSSNSVFEFEGFFGDDELVERNKMDTQVAEVVFSNERVNLLSEHLREIGMKRTADLIDTHLRSDSVFGLDLVEKTLKNTSMYTYESDKVNDHKIKMSDISLANPFREYARFVDQECLYTQCRSGNILLKDIYNFLLLDQVFATRMNISVENINSFTYKGGGKIGGLMHMTTRVKWEKEFFFRDFDGTPSGINIRHGFVYILKNFPYLLHEVNREKFKTIHEELDRDDPYLKKLKSLRSSIVDDPAFAAISEPVRRQLVSSIFPVTKAIKDFYLLQISFEELLLIFEKRNPSIPITGNTPDEKLRSHLRQLFNQKRMHFLDIIEKRSKRKIPKEAEEYAFAVEYFSDRLENLLNFVSRVDWVDPPTIKK